MGNTFLAATSSSRNIVVDLLVVEDHADVTSDNKLL